MTARRRGSGAARYGFSLAELIAVLAVAALLTGLAMPQALSYLRSAKLRGAAEQIATALRLARQLAITRNQSVCVQTTAAALRYRIAGCAGLTWTGPGTDASGNIPAPAGVSLSATASPVFSHLGSASPAATYTVADPQSARQLHVTVAASGRVSVGP
jgi:prepilin-type N-terminal cleavage/methylation domain-containing protein